MKITSYTAKRGTGEKKTTKDISGSYSSSEDSYEVTMTFEAEGKVIDIEEANKIVDQTLDNLKKPKSEKDPDWITEKVINEN